MRLLILVVGTYAAAYVRGHYAASQLQRAEAIGRTAVWAVEQLARASGWDSRTKYGKALQFARRLAARAGLRLDDDQWQAVLEAAVAAMGGVSSGLGAGPLPAPPRRPPQAAAGPRPR